MSYLFATEPPTETPAAASMLLPGMETLSMKSAAPTGCSMHAGKSTLIAFYVASKRHLDLIMASVAPIVKLAKKNNNKVTYAVLGVADDAEAVAAVLETVPRDQRVLLLGASELKYVKNETLLKEGVLMQFVPDSAGSQDGTWLLPSSGDACLSLVPQGNMTLLEWKDAINALDKTGLVLEASAASRLPFEQLGVVSGITATTQKSIPTMQQTREWIVSDAHCWPDTQSHWSEVTSNGTPAWAVSTSCSKMVSALSVPPVKLDRQLTHADLQYDVSLTLASLLSQTSHTFESLKGVIGPVVLAGRDENEPMRVIEWQTASDHALVMLLPETYMQIAFADYNNGSDAGTAVPQWLSSFLCLENKNVIPLKVNGCAAEAEDIVAQMGPRLFSLPSQNESVIDTEAVMQALHRAETVRENLVYTTQQDARLTQQVEYGKRVSNTTTGTHSVFFTNTPSNDHLTGLRVRWVFAADRPTMPTLDTSTDQLEYEHTVRSK